MPSSTGTPTNDRAASQDCEGREQLEVLVRLVPVALVIVDREGTVLFWNPEAERMFGWSRSEVIGRRPPIVKEEAEEECNALLQQVLSGKEIRGFETKRLRKDGKWLDVAISATPVRDGNGRITGVAGMFKDVTSRKKAARTVAEQSRLARFTAQVCLAVVKSDNLRDMLQRCAQSCVDILDAAFARIWTLNETGNVLELQASAGMYTHINGAHGRVPVGAFKIGRIAQDRQPHLTNSVVTDSWVGDPAWARREGMVAFAGYPLLIGDKVVGVMAMFSRKTLSDPTLDAMAAVANAVTIGIQRRRAEEALQESERKYAELVRESPDGIVLVDPGGRILSVNPAAERLTGLSANEIVGREIGDVGSLGASSALKVRAEMARALAGEKGPPHEISFVRQQGSEVVVEAISRPLLRDGKVALVQMVLREVTERKRLEAEKLALLKIEQERDTLRSALRAFERVLGVVGHELRTPLAGVRAMAEMLLEDGGRSSAETAGFIEGIHDEVVRMAGMVNDLLEVARLNGGRARWNWSAGFNVAKVCAIACDAVRPTVDSMKVKLSHAVEPGDLSMNGDPGAIRRLLINLLTNAQKHTPEGRITLHVRSLARDGHVWAEILVSDTGRGMPPEIAARLGVPFALNSGVIGDAHVKGSGLGLAISKGIVAAHGGAITVDTGPGKGTTVAVRIRADLPGPASVDEAASIVARVDT